MTGASPIETVPAWRHDGSTAAPAAWAQLAALSVAVWSAPSFDDVGVAATGGCGSPPWPAVPLCGDVAALVETGDRMRLLVADVSGHGLGAAPLAGVLHSVFVGFASCSGTGLPSLATILDDVVARSGADEAYATACLVDLYTDGTVVLANCGHPWPLASDMPGRWDKLPPNRSSLPLGVGARPSCDVYTFNAGSRIVVHTDGVALCRAAGADRPDVEALVAGVLGTGPRPAHRPADDATVVVGRWAPPTEEPTNAVEETGRGS